MATPSVRIVKSMDFKGGTRLYGNRYHFLGGTPADDTHWHTLFDNIVAAEKLMHNTTVTIVEAIGYAAGSDVPVSSKNYSTAGTHTAAGQIAPGEVCALVRLSTAARSTKNHPIYGFNYYHCVDLSGSAHNQDYLQTTTKGLIDTYAAAWISGFSDGTNTYTRCTPPGHAVTGHFTEEFVTHRDFPYTRSA